jgi:hypothetical protein
MEIEVKVSEKTEDVLWEIAKLKGCSANEAAKIVLERYAQRAKKEIESAVRLADRL